MNVQVNNYTDLTRFRMEAGQYLSFGTKPLKACSLGSKADMPIVTPLQR